MFHPFPCLIGTELRLLSPYIEDPGKQETGDDNSSTPVIIMSTQLDSTAATPSSTSLTSRATSTERSTSRSSVKTAASRPCSTESPDEYPGQATLPVTTGNNYRHLAIDINILSFCVLHSVCVGMHVCACVCL